MLESKGNLDEKVLREIGKDLLPVWHQRLMFALGALAIALAVLEAASNRYVYAAFMLFVAVFVAAMVAVARRNIVRINLKRMRETTGTCSIGYTVRLGDAAVEVENESTGGAASIPYEKFVRMCETEDAYILITEGQQIVPVSKSELGDSDAFLDYLDGKPTRIKKMSRKGAHR